MYTLQDAYVGRTHTTTLQNNAMQDAGLVCISNDIESYPYNQYASSFEDLARRQLGLQCFFVFLKYLLKQMNMDIINQGIKSTKGCNQIQAPHIRNSKLFRVITLELVNRLRASTDTEKQLIGR
jgi:hypothetical protein